MVEPEAREQLRERIAEEARELLVERIRLGIWISLLACLGFVVVDAATHWTIDASRHWIGVLQAVLLAITLLVVGRPYGRSRAVGIALVAMAVVCGLGFRGAVMGGDQMGYQLLLVALTMGAAAFVPWSLGAQIGLVAIASACATAAAVGSVDDLEHIGDPAAIGVAISFLASIYVARVLQRERTAAQGQELQRAIASEQFAASREQLRALSARLVSVQEGERTRIAREVHDELGQKLTALKFMASALHDRASSSPDLARQAGEMIELLETTLQAVQRIAKALRPLVLDDLGFGAALTSLVNEFEEQTGIACEIRVDEPLEIDRDGSTALYRIVQEALTNVARHANATRVEVAVRRRSQSVELRVEDDGRGLAWKRRRAPSALGILGMQERARSCGGDVEVVHLAGGGLTVVATVVPSESVEDEAQE